MDGSTPNAQQLISPHRRDEYSFRVPTPPRIVVPPPALNANALPDFTLEARQNSHFLQDVNYANLVQSNALLDWSYERRRQAQMVLPFLYLGPMVAVKDRAFLINKGITMVIGLRYKQGFESKLINGALRVVDELGIPRTTIDLTGNSELISAFHKINSTINQHLGQTYQAQRTGKVLLFCESGNERSAGAAAAYLMEMHNDVDYIKAMQICQSQRFCVNFDDGMKRVLQSYWDILRAKRDVGAAEVPTAQVGHVPPPSRPAQKRGLERDGEEEDGEMDDMDEDVERFQRRTFAPFVDMSQ